MSTRPYVGITFAYSEQDGTMSDLDVGMEHWGLAPASGYQ